MCRLNSTAARALRWSFLLAAVTLAACGGGGKPEVEAATSAAPTVEAIAAATTPATADLPPSSKAKAAAVTGGGGGETVYTEAGKLVRADPSIGALGTGLFGEKVNLYNGTVDFVQTDLSLPGNSAPPVSVARKLGTGSMALTVGIFGDWDLEIPRMQGIYAQSKGWTVGGVVAADIDKRCSKFGAPPASMGMTNQGSFYAEEYWHGHFLYVPGSGAQEVLTRNPGTPSPTDGNTYPLTTKSLWSIRCLSALQNGVGEGFIAVSPDGTQYRFDWMATRTYPGTYKTSPAPALLAPSRATAQSAQVGKLPRPAAITPPLPSLIAGGYYLPRVEVWLMPTLVTDRYGNTVTYTYNTSLPWRVNTIVASDAAGSPRTLSFNYVASTTTSLVSSVSDGTRTWNYAYRATTGGNVLSTVTQPDLSSWTFNLDALTMTPGLSAGTGTCDLDMPLNTTPLQGTIVHPSGATGTFTFAATQHGRSYVEQLCRGDVSTDDSYSTFPKYIDAFSIQNKSVSGPGMAAATWTYAYGPANASFTPCTGCADTKTVTVTDPRAVATRYTFGNRHRVSEGQLLQVDAAWNGSSALRATATQYRSPTAGPYVDPVGYTPQQRTIGDIGYRHTPETSRATTQQGVTFTWLATAFDIYARPTSVARSSSLGMNRSELTAYADHTAKWILGQIASVTETTTGAVMQSHSYDPVTANRTASYAFTRLTDSYSYNADGTLLTHKDGANHTTTFSNYKRGLAQNIAYADSTAESAAVNNLGLITTHTNPAGTTTGYGYDAMGRLASITPPGGDAVAYHATTLLFEKVQAAEVGIAAGHWRQTVTTGNARTLRYYDALWRERLSSTSDIINPAGTGKAVETRYDFDGRKLFTSYAQRSIAAVDTALPGVSSVYDGLGRITSQVQASELGNLSTGTAYLAGFTRRVTNPRGYASWTA